ncbi:Uncharacterised protein [Mycobacteroides abscessus subsp. massiliense]|nr:hypothetical protein PROPHIT493_55 [Mycobacterium phage prophiT49-3]SKM98131.1 Uncharacterised protein [Mycobacteroides abscessus subsp. massiliense]
MDTVQQQVNEVAERMQPHDKYYSGWIHAMAKAPTVTPERLREVISDARERIAQYESV